MDNLFNQLYNQYNNLLSDLKIGYPMSDDKLDEMWSVIHKLHFIKYETNSSSNILKILEYYEYV